MWVILLLFDTRLAGLDETKNHKKWPEWAVGGRGEGDIKGSMGLLKWFYCSVGGLSSFAKHVGYLAVLFSTLFHCVECVHLALVDGNICASYYYMFLFCSNLVCLIPR